MPRPYSKASDPTKEEWQQKDLLDHVSKTINSYVMGKGSDIPIATLANIALQITDIYLAVVQRLRRHYEKVEEVQYGETVDEANVLLQEMAAGEDDPAA